MFLEKYKVVRRLTLVWACWLITATVDTYRANVGEVNASDATIIMGVIGILSVVIGFQAGKERNDWTH